MAEPPTMTNAAVTAAAVRPAPGPTPRPDPRHKGQMIAIAAATASTSASTQKSIMAVGPRVVLRPYPSLHPVQWGRHRRAMHARG